MNRSLFRLLSTLVIIISTIYICEKVTFWFYPIGIIIIGSQYLTLTLFGHESVHGLLHRNRFINRSVGRYLCHFPFLISHTHYSMNHLRHHRNLGTPDDPDINIYQNAYPSFWDWIQRTLQNLLNFTLLRNFINYFNGIDSYLKGEYPFKIKTDYLEFFAFWAGVLAIVYLVDIKLGFVLYWLLPGLLILPWVHLLNSYQHYSEDGPTTGRAYNILFSNGLIKEVLFPVNVNLHEVHHQRPDLPYYKLTDHYSKSKNSITFLDFSKKLFNSQKNKTP